MSELARLAQPLIDRPFVVAPSKEQLRHRTRTRHRHRAVGGGTAAVIVMVVALVVAILSSSSTSVISVPPRATLASFIQQGVSVPDSVLEAVDLPSSVTPPLELQNQPPLGPRAKVNVVYIGGEFCPYCAVQRWALIVALSRFGDFSHLGQIATSSSTDVFPGLKSWSFLGSSFSSPSVSFHPAEIYSSMPNRQGKGYEPLQKLSSLEKRAFDAYDNQAALGGALPFIDVNNRFIAVGAGANPAVLEGLSLDQIGLDLSQASSPVAQAVDGTANYLIAALCAGTGATKPPICSTPFVSQALARMDPTNER
jgi:Domain of unknown function (DUF929)